MKMQCFIYFFIVLPTSLATDVAVYNPSEYYNASPETEVDPVSIFTSPWKFGFKWNDRLYMVMKYINKPPNVTVINVKYESGLETFWESNVTLFPGTNVLVHSRLLRGPEAIINLQLCTSNDMCSSIRVAEGRLLSTTSKEKTKKYKYNDICLKETMQPCVLLVDLKDLICNDTSERRTRIMKPPIIYDNNCSNMTVYFKKLSPSVNYKIYYKADEKKNNITYSNYEVKTFEKGKCFSIIKKDKPKHILTSIYLEWERDAGKFESLTIFEGGSENSNKAANSGYVYNHKCLSSPSCTIEVDLENECADYFINKTQTEATTTTVSDTSTHIVSTTENLLERKKPGPVPDSNEITYTSPHEYVESTTNRKIGNDTKSTKKQSQHSQNDVLIYVIPCVIGMCLIIILVIYICVKKYCHRIADPVEAIELNTYATINEVLYADLSLMHGDSQPPRHVEEITYAKIIGVMKPVHVNVKNKKK